MVYFVKIVELGSMTKASAMLNVTQSALSLSIKKLEEEFGLSLFIKNGRNIIPSTYGDFFYKRAKKIISDIDTLKNDLDELCQKKIEHIKIDGNVIDFTVNSIDIFSNIYPGIKILYNRNNKNLAAKESLVFDKSIFHFSFFKEFSEEIIYEELLNEPLLFIVSNKHPLASKKEVSLKDIENETFISLCKGSSLRELHDHILTKGGLRINDFIELNDPESFIFSVISNKGVALMPRSIRNYQVLPECPIDTSKTIAIPIKEDFCKRTIYISYLKNHSFTNGQNIYLDFIRSYGELTSSLKTLPSINDYEQNTRKFII